jgi:hypothetical protein
VVQCGALLRTAAGLLALPQLRHQLLLLDLGGVLTSCVECSRRRHRLPCCTRRTGAPDHPGGPDGPFQPLLLLSPPPCAGLWATLQFKWIQLQYPAVVLAFEKLLLTGCIPVAAAVITWGLAAGVGMSNAPFFLATILCGLYFLFGRPLPSSFHSSKQTALGEWRQGIWGLVWCGTSILGRSTQTQMIPCAL